MAKLNKSGIMTVEDVSLYILSFTAPAIVRHARISFKRLLMALG